MKKTLKKLVFPIILVVVTINLQAQSKNLQAPSITGPWKLAGNTASGGEKLGTINAVDLNLYTNNVNRMTITSTGLTAGSVGIGTTTPVNKVEIDVTKPEDGIRVVQYGVNGINGAAALHLKNNTPGGKMWSLLSLGSGNTIQGTGNFLIQESDDYGVNYFDRFIIQKTTGNVGIGTVKPKEKLHIDKGAIRITGNNGNGGPMILFGGSVANSGEWGIEYTNNLTAHNGLNFWKPFGSSNGGNNFLFLNDNGNIGVGTDNPTAQFTVTGNVLIGDASTQLPAGYKLYVEKGILTEKVKVAVKNSANWADYVFDPNYKLMPLEEIKQYVAINKHLPNVPSADALKNEGLDLGNMAAMQMQKIEELTLHLIQINERLEKLEKENAVLKNTDIPSPVK